MKRPVNLNQEELDKIRTESRKQDIAKKEKEAAEKRKKEEFKEKMQGKMKAVVKKRTAKSWKYYYDEYKEYALIGVFVLGFLWLFFTNKTSETRSPKEIPVNDDALISGVNSARRLYTVEANTFFEGWNLEKANEILRNNLSKRKSVSKCSLSGTVPEKYLFSEEYPNCKSSIIDQKGCASAFAFAPTGVVADRKCRATGKKITLSAQHPLTCEKSSSFGCQGGTVVGTLDIGVNSGFVEESCLKYNPEDTDECKKDQIKDCERTFVQDYCMAEGVEEIKKAIVSGGPVIGMLGATKELLIYKEGIYDESYSEYRLDGYQPVKIVGWDFKEKFQYWIIENSWGTSWGQKGIAYIRIGVSSTLDRYAISVNLKN